MLCLKYLAMMFRMEEDQLVPTWTFPNTIILCSKTMFLQLQFSKIMFCFKLPSIVSCELANNDEDTMHFYCCILGCFACFGCPIVVNICPSSTILNIKNMALIVFQNQASCIGALVDF